MSTRLGHQSTNQEAHQPMLTDGSAVARRKYPPHGKHPSSPYTDALQQWKSTRSRLGAIIQEYLDACTTLKDVCAQPPPSSSDERWLDPVLIAVNSELPSIVSDESKMREAGKQLGIARNYSPNLVRINRLPPEVLTQIFGHVLALNGCYVPDPPRTRPSEPVNEYARTYLSFHSTTLDVISGVCTHWRQLAINTPAFWTHLDFNLCDDDSRDRGVPRTECFVSRAELWISRTRGCPLSVHIFDHGGFMTDGDVPYYRVLRLLTKHVSRIATLSLEFFESAGLQISQGT
ncbi:hypothetical protein FRC08_017177 [Ceratobasidium sp. 394]|nr:hypothetical protein FRC08_017177 [Ceratobasidium sp. 394]